MELFYFKGGEERDIYPVNLGACIANSQALSHGSMKRTKRCNCARAGCKFDPTCKNANVMRCAIYTLIFIIFIFYFRKVLTFNT